MSKLYFLVPDIRLATRIVAELKAAGVTEDNIGAVANDKHDMDDLPTADPADTSDLASSTAPGVAAGSATGLLAGLAAAAIPGGLVIGGAALAGMVLAGGAFGAWISSMIGISVPGEEVEKFEDAINSGSILMIVHAEELDREKIKRIVTDQHPEVVFGGEDNAVPPVV